MRLNPIPRLLLLAALIGLVPGIYSCRNAPPPIVYYTLDPLPQSDTPVPPPVEQPALRIGVGPIDLPTYLDRPQIVTRSGEYTLAINDFDRWAGPLDEEIQRMLLNSLEEALPGAEVLAFPWDRMHEPTHQVRLTIQRFDGQEGDSVHLRGTWHLINRTNPEKNLTSAFEITEAVSAKTMRAVVAAQNRALAALAGQIVGALCSVTESG
jgi:uncharacterized protein